jgi:hypothetical protein
MDPSIIECSDQLVLRPSITRVDGRPILSKTQALVTSQGMSPVIEMTLRDLEGRPINFESCGFESYSSSSSSSALQGKVLLKAKEVFDTNSTTPVVDIEGLFVNAAAGVVRAKIPVASTELNGIFQGNWGVMSASNELIHSSQFYLVVEKSQFSASGSDNGSGLPSINEVRLYLKDSSPEDNPLLNTLEFDLPEICEAMILCVQHWNTMQPRVRVTFSTKNFPRPSVMLNGIMGELYLSAAKHYRRNQLNYTAGGLAIDDKNKSQEYEAVGDRMLQDYLKWVKMTKIQINKEAWDGSFGSTYSGLGRYR